MINIQDQIDSLRESLNSQAVGLQNVYSEFEKYNLSDISKRIENLSEQIKKYELQKHVKEFDIDVCPYPMNIRINLRVKTNFGLCSYSFDYPPALEYQLCHAIQGTYVSMLESLYKAHDDRGGKYPGDNECKAWHDENGDTIVDMGELRMKR